MGGSTPSRPRRGFWIALLVLGLVALIAVGALAAYELRYNERVYEGVSVAGIPLGGLTQAEAARTIADQLTPFPGAAITVRYGARTWSLTPAELGVAVDAQATAVEAFAAGREGAFSSAGAPPAALWAGLRRDLVTQWEALKDGKAVSPTVRLNENRLALALKQIAAEVDLRPREATLSIAGLDVSGTPGQPGRVVRQDETRAAIEAALRSETGGTVDLVVEEQPPAVLSVDAALATARGLLHKSVIAVAEAPDGVRKFAIEPALLSEWLALSPAAGPDRTVQLGVTLNRDKVAGFVAEIAAQINQPAYDAVLDWDAESSHVIVLTPSQVGRWLDAGAAVDALEAAILQDAGQPTTAAASAVLTTTQVITLPVNTVLPTIDSNRVAEMGIVEQISEGTTYFAGSSRERIQNIVNAASKFVGAVVPPDKDFSFYRTVGDVSTANGFVDSLIISGDRTEVGVGGGVCQVSTTVFRAAFWGGFPIVERYPHGYVVGWYGDPGLDASIFTPSADFRFLNDTGHFILVKPDVDSRKGRITFHIYGTKPDRTIEADKGVITKRERAPDPLYEEDDTLDPGVIKQVDWAKEGMDVTVTRTIRYGDGRVKRDQVVSHYRPWQAVYLYGPGTELPPEASGD